MRYAIFVATSLFLLSFGLSERAIAQLAEDTDSETTSAGASRTAADKAPRDFSSAVEQIIEQTQAFRAEQEVGDLEVNSQLTETAAYFAQYMARTGKYGHTADGRRPSERAKAHGYEFCLVSENIANVFSSRRLSDDDLAQRFVEGWKDSPEHRKNMLEPAVTEIGVAVAQSPESGYIFAVQMFGRPEAAAIRFEIANQTQDLVHYELGEQTLELPPGYTRIHKRCRSGELRVLSETDQEPLETIEPQSGDQLTLVAAPQGGLEIQRQSAEAQTTKE